jgi:tyrosine-specific transport protein
MKSKENSVFSIILAGFLVGGYTIGAGVLGLPIITGLAGFIPVSIAMLFIWIALYGLSWYLATLFIVDKDVTYDYITLFNRELGPLGKWVTIIGFLIIYYGALTAYLSGAANIARNLFHLNISMYSITLICFTFYSLIIIYGIKAVEKGNFIFMIVLLISFAYLICSIMPSVNLKYFSYINWSFLPKIFSILIFSSIPFLIVPSICRPLNYARKPILISLIIGGIISFSISYLWTATIIGVLPLTGSGTNNILYAFKHNLSAAVPLAQGHTNTIFFATAIFSILAISTSYLGTGIAILEFIKDYNHFNFKIKNKTVLFIIAFLPSLLVTLYKPNLFISLLNFVGGAGFCLVGGVLPALILVKNIKKIGIKKIGAILLLILLTAIVLLEILQRIDLLKITPKIINSATLIFI